MDRRDKEIQYLHRKLQEYEERVEDLQEQLLREVERRHQEKALADTACEALEGKLRKAEDEMHDLLATTLQTRRHATHSQSDLRKEVDRLRRSLAHAEGLLEAPRPAQQKSGLSAEDTNEIRRILCTHMNCGETELEQRGIPRALESRAVVTQESLRCLTTFVAELGQLVWEDAGEADAGAGDSSGAAAEAELAHGVVTHRASADLHLQLKRLMIRCEDLLALKPDRRQAPARAELVKAVVTAYRTADSCQKQVTAMVRRCHNANAYGRFPKEHQANLQAVEQLTASVLERLQYAADRCLRPDECLGPGRLGPPAANRARSPTPPTDGISARVRGRAPIPWPQRH